MDRITLKIDGMVCSMCEAHICDAIRKAVPAAKKVTASRSRKEASFLTGTPVDPELLTSAVNATGYSCLSVTAEPFGKRGLLGWR